MRYNIFGMTCWYIEKPSKQFKEKYPKQFIVISITRDDVRNIDNLAELPYNPSDIDYLFTYNNELCDDDGNGCWSWTSRTDEDDTNDLLQALPCDLSYMFVDTSSDIDTVISITPKNSTKDPRLIQPVIIRQNHKFLEEVDLKASLNKIIKIVYRKNKLSDIKDTESWLLHIIEEPPVGLFGEPYRFGKVIEDKMFKPEINAELEDFIIGYNARIPDLQEEFKFMSMIEREFSNFNSDVTIYNNYNGIVDRIAKACTAKKVKYTKNGDISIKLNANDFYNLDLDFNITDFIM